MSNRYEFLGTTADDQALALKMYMSHFTEAPRSSVFLWDTGLPVIERKTVTAGKSHQFLMQALDPDAEEFTPGDEMIGQAGAVEEGTIGVDKYIVASKFVPQDQMKISHFDILPRLAKAQKLSIERRYDKRIFTVAALAAREAAATKNGLTVHSGGNVVTRSGTAAIATAYPASTTGAANFRADLRTLALNQDIDNIDPENRYLWLTPYMRSVIQYDNTAQVFSQDYIDGENKQQKRQITLLEGYKIIGFPNTTSAGGPFPNENIANESLSKYNGNFTIGASTGTPVALALSGGMDGSAAVGLLTFESIQNFVIYQQEKLGWLVGSYVLCGAGKLNPWCAGSVEVIV